MSPPRIPGPDIPADPSTAVELAISSALLPDEGVDQVARAVGCTIVLTGRRVLIVRDGSSYRPKSGLRSFELGPDLAVRIGPARRRVWIEWRGRRTTAFVRPEQLADAELLVNEARRRIQVARHDEA